LNGKIAVEEHFAIEETLDGAMNFKSSDAMTTMRANILDVHDQRLRLMDRHGIEMMVLSLNAPAVQSISDPKRAVDVARRANDALAREIDKRRDRFAGFAAVAMQDPEAAVAEAKRAVRELGFCGVLVNGYSECPTPGRALYYDLPEYDVFWATLQELKAPLYLHTRDPLPDQQKVYEGHPWLTGAAWAFGAEAAAHAARLMCAGVFDRYPSVQIILGHLGEGMPYNIWRLEHRVKKSPRGIPAKKPLGDYFRTNFYISVSGNFSTPTLLSALDQIGPDRVLFAIDYPFEEVAQAAEWIEAAEISEDVRRKIIRDNAIALFELDRGVQAKVGPPALAES
jgi:gamma-resorcylate decarboxylase